MERLKKIIENHDCVFVITDYEVAMFWLPEFMNWIGEPKAFEYVMRSGEKEKNLSTVRKIWSFLLKHNASRNSLIINLGGGTVSDIGGFAAACFQRGVDFVNVPTTLLSMVDASIGGKNGIDFQGYKNQIGTFKEPLEVVLVPTFLSTLPEREMLSGMAEMLKYGFIADSSFLNLAPNNVVDFIERAVEIKKNIVRQDSEDHGLRQVLNFGHTVGHGLEACMLNAENQLVHGEAVALGMFSALWLSIKYTNLNPSYLDEYKSIYQRLMCPIRLDAGIIGNVVEKIRHDKKNRGGEMNFVLLSDLEKPVLNVVVNEGDVKESLEEMIKWQASLFC